MCSDWKACGLKKHGLTRSNCTCRQNILMIVIKIRAGGTGDDVPLFIVKGYQCRKVEDRFLLGVF